MQRIPLSPFGHRGWPEPEVPLAERRPLGAPLRVSGLGAPLRVSGLGLGVVSDILEALTAKEWSLQWVDLWCFRVRFDASRFW